MIYQIMNKYFSQERNNDDEKKASVFEFLFQCLEFYNSDASVLFTLIPI